MILYQKIYVFLFIFFGALILIAGPPPVADAGPDQTVYTGDTVIFDGSGSFSKKAVLVAYEWNFGDGNTASGEVVEHSYSAAGTFTVTLKVTESTGKTATDTALVTVISGGAGMPPVADAGPDRTVSPGTEVMFDGSGSTDPDGEITAYQWDFGDGNAGTGIIVSHTYAAAGSYTVELMVTDNESMTGTDTAVVTVQDQGGNEVDPGSIPQGLKVYVTGNPEWVTTAHQPGVVYMGGGAEADEAMAWLTGRTGGGDLVVIRTDRSDAYNDYLYNTIGGVDSVHTLVVNSTALADSFYVGQVIRNAEALWIAGGDQTEYYELWKGTGVESAIDHLLNVKHATVGGTSAGMAILGQVDYIPLNYGIYSAEALGDPYHSYMQILAADFVNTVPYSAGMITDTHFSERDRLGRTIVFLARNIADGRTSVGNTRAIACDEGAAVCVDGSGNARIFGWEGYSDYVYFFKADTVPDICTTGEPLHWINAVTVYKVRGLPDGSGTFSLVNWTGTGGSWEDVNVNNGTIDNDIQEPD